MRDSHLNQYSCAEIDVHTKEHERLKKNVKTYKLSKTDKRVHTTIDMYNIYLE